MKKSIRELETLVRGILSGINLPHDDIDLMVKIYLDATARDVGHHDLSFLPGRVAMLRKQQINSDPQIKRLTAYGAMESWDGDNGLGEVLCTHLMKRAVALADSHGIGFCTIRNSNHYLAGAPYVNMAAEAGCIGMIMVKGVPTMGVPGINKTIIGQSPLALAFPTGHEWPVMMDVCLAYASGGLLAQKAAAGEAVPEWWGVSRDGNQTTDPAELLQGIKYPIGGHKGFGLALLCELLTGVMSGGLILDQDEEVPLTAVRSSSHTAIAIKTDALMDGQRYKQRSDELLNRIKERSDQVRIPGERAYYAGHKAKEQELLNVSEQTMEQLYKLYQELNIEAGGAV